MWSSRNSYSLKDYSATLEARIAVSYKFNYSFHIWYNQLIKNLMPLHKHAHECFSFFFPFICISWRLITLQYCSGFCHTLTWISHGFTCIPHPDPPSHLPLHPIPLGLPVHQAQALVSCIQPGLVICFTLDNIHVSMLFSWNIPPSPSPTESKSLFYTCVSLFLFCI